MNRTPAGPSAADLHELRARLSSPALDQGHLFSEWSVDHSEYTPQQRAMLTELHAFYAQYPGGVEAYIRNGRQLLKADSAAATAAGSSTYLQLEKPPLLFTAPKLYAASPELSELEACGADLARRCVYVLVAGGLGERLGYSGIKAALPVEMATMRSYLQHYLDWAKAAAGPEVPFVIMTSGDTHAQTEELLARLRPGMPNLRLLKQETVFCFTDVQAHLALSKDGALLRKPHGHGDVHSLIHAAAATADPSPSLVESWLAMGCQYIAFFQDTNAPAIVTIPISLAVAQREGLDMSFTCIPRQPKEAVGVLCHALRSRARADDSDDNSGSSGRESAFWSTSIVEYNVLESLGSSLDSETDPGAAPLPGSVNTLVLNLASYARVLEQSQGCVPEFINPKYADAARHDFKKPARVESLMQDVALLFSGSEHRVGGTVYDRFIFQPVKNSLPEACNMARRHMSPYGAMTGEADYYELVRRRLKAVGVPLSYSTIQPDVVVGGAIYAHLFPIIVLDANASVGATGSGIGGLADLAAVFPQPARVKISPESTLIVEGSVIIESLDLHGALRIIGPPRGSLTGPIVVRGLRVRTRPWLVREATSADADEVHAMRGFILNTDPTKVVSYRPRL